jgi:hypothetical protein
VASRQQLASIIARLRAALLTRENLWAVVLGLLILLTFTCATTGVQPEFVYTGF